MARPACFIAPEWKAKGDPRFKPSTACFRAARPYGQRQNLSINGKTRGADQFETRLQVRRASIVLSGLPLNFVIGKSRKLMVQIGRQVPEFIFQIGF